MSQQRRLTALEARTAAVRLTPKELDVLRLIAAGRNNNEIAVLLSSSRSTVESHARRLYRKLQVRSRSQAIMRGHMHGLLTGPASPKTSCRKSQTKSGPVFLGDSATLAVGQMVNGLSLVMVYGELLLHHMELPEDVREPLNEMLAGAQKVAWSLQAVGSEESIHRKSREVAGDLSVQAWISPEIV